jgi:hypothetical protein
MPQDLVPINIIESYMKIGSLFIAAARLPVYLFANSPFFTLSITVFFMSFSFVENSKQVSRKLSLPKCARAFVITSQTGSLKQTATIAPWDFSGSGEELFYQDLGVIYESNVVISGHGAHIMWEMTLLENWPSV